MASQLAAEGKLGLDSAVQQSILQQAEAVLAAQGNPTTSTGHDDAQQHADTINVEEAGDDIPPPAYGEAYGEIRSDNNGLGTSASAAGDGRVNIRINQLNRRLSQMFTPALRQQIHSAQDSCPVPPPYVPPSLGGDDSATPPPPLNIVIQVVGSRGDVQPFIALGKVLKERYRHRVRLATHFNFRQSVQEHGLEFFSIGGDPSGLMTFMVKNPSLMPGFRSMISGDVGKRRKDVAEYIQGCWRSCYQAGDGTGSEGASEMQPFVADCIIANPPSFAHIHCAEKLGIPLHIMFTMPYSPTEAFPHPLANIQYSNADPQLTNYISYGLIELLSWQGLGEIINRFRAKCLGLDPVSLVWGPGMLQRLKIPHTYCWSPSLLPKPEDWGQHLSISGFYLLDSASNYTPSPDLQAFLAAGPPPVYIGFGSIILDDPNAMTQLIFNATRKSGQRVLLCKGWGGMGADELLVPDDVFLLGNVPHDWLFGHVSCIVHHGGAGTTAAGIAAGRPTIIVPFFGDQPFWGAMVARAGAGPDPIPHKLLTADKLADAISFCLRPERVERARELSQKMAAERGSEVGAQLFHQYLEPDRLRCMVAPERPAAWRIKGTKVRLSAFAACTLANANLLSFKDLKIFRPQEYETDEGPWDPISGGFVTVCEAFGSMALGLIAEFPSETLKAVQLPFKDGRKQFKKPALDTTKDHHEISYWEGSSGASTASTHSPTSLTAQEQLAQVGSSHVASRDPSPSSASSTEPVSYYNNSRSHSKQDETRIRQNGSGSQPGAAENRDMLRHTGAHTSKGLGRFAKALVQSPMELSMSFTKGFNNLSKLWGDDTVRPQEKVSDFKSGAKAAGKVFGLGWYDGVTGLATQPWLGAKKEGASGFLKGIGKGMGGFITKPGAAIFGIHGYVMKGAHKEVQKLFGSNVQTYIVTSRTTQGYGEWLQSSDEEKQDIITRWELIEKIMKKKSRSRHEVIQDTLQAQHRMKSVDGGRDHRVAASTHPGTLGCTNHNTGSVVGAAELPEVFQDLQTASGTSTRVELPAPDTSHAHIEEAVRVNDDPARDISPLLQRQHWETANEQQGEQQVQQSLLLTLEASRAEAQLHIRDGLEYEEGMQRAMAQSMEEQRQCGSIHELEATADSTSHHAVEPGCQYPHTRLPMMVEMDVAVDSRSFCADSHGGHDLRHLGGTTEAEFDVQRRGYGEKTLRELAEEDIVMEYIKKQSILEHRYQEAGKGKGKDFAAATGDSDDEDLQKALKLSLRGSGDSAER